VLPEYQPQWTVERGVEELLAAYRRESMTREEFLGSRYLRILHLKELLSDNQVDASLYWQGARAES
jgi:hypothetical protein